MEAVLPSQQQRGRNGANKRRVNFVLLAISLLALGTIVAVALFALLDLRETALLGWALTGAVAATALARPFRGAWLLGSVLGAAAFLGAHAHRIASAGDSWLELRAFLPALPGVLSLLVIGLLGSFVHRQLAKIQAELERDDLLIDQLTRHDEATGTLKPVYGVRLLSDEIERARRYGRSLSVVLIGPDDWSRVVAERGEEQAAKLLAMIGKLLIEKLRASDTPCRYDESRFMAILPETPATGAQIVAERLCKEIAARTAVQFRAGVAEFPSDALGKDELIAEAEAALGFARSAGIISAGRGLLI